MARDQLERFRTSVADDRRGRELEAAIAEARRQRLDIGGIEPALVTAPRGWPKDHPRVGLLRMKGLITLRDLGAPAWIHTRRAVNEVAKAMACRGPGDLLAGTQRRPDRGARHGRGDVTNRQYPRQRTRCGRRTMRPLITAIAVAALVLSAPATTSAGAPPDSSTTGGDAVRPAWSVRPIDVDRRRAAGLADLGDRRHRRCVVHSGRLHRHAGARRAVRHVVQQLPATAPQDAGGGGDHGGSCRRDRPERGDRPVP